MNFRAVFILVVTLFYNIIGAQAQLVTSYSHIVKKVSPTVVNIYTKQRVKSVNYFLNDSFFKQFFDHEFFDDLTRDRIENSLGSGVIISSDGVIVTNAHVVNNSEMITVVMSDGTEYEADILLQDRKLDLVLLKIKDSKGKKFDYIEFYDSDNLEIGDIVLAIGNPFGVGQTVTSGIISALSRSSKDVSTTQLFIQTDAAINPGNSGGALVNLEGKLIGINTAIYTKSGGSNGIGFSIPSNTVSVFIKNINEDGEIVRSWLGVKTQDISNSIADSLGIELKSGAIVNQVHRYSPLYGRLQIADVITNVNGKKVSNAQEFKFRIFSLSVGSEVRLNVKRADKNLLIVSKIIMPPEIPKKNEIALSGDHFMAGVRVVNLSPLVNSRLEIDSFMQGVAISRVTNGSIASKVGLRVRDIIKDINGTEIADTNQLRQLLKSSNMTQQDGWTLTTIRNGSKITTYVSKK